MNILVIGNGFDLAHGLPTKYTDFLDFVRIMYQIVEKVPVDRIYYGGLEQEIKMLVQKKVDTININRWKTLIYDNLWIKYLWWNPLYKNENWIDFENEISNVIQGIDNDMHGLTDVYELNDKIENISNVFLNKWYYDSRITYKELRDRLLSDLGKLTKALELYLCEFVEKIKCIRVLPDIRDLYFDKILSFNYTDTYKKIYDPNELSEYDYIHGKVNLDYSLEVNNLVLGIDEYLSEERKNKDVEFIAFKKFFQRIHKRTGSKYKEWVDDIRSDLPIENLKAAYIDKSGFKVYEREISEYHNLYIFGHSLDVTDKDVFRDLILNDNVHTTIFYYNKDDFGAKITNLVKVIGQDELIRRSGGKTRTIEFRSSRVW